MLDSYAAAVADPNDELTHLYEVRDAAVKRFGKEKKHNTPWMFQTQTGAASGKYVMTSLSDRAGTEARNERSCARPRVRS
jgi:hypothetical protein